MVDTIACVRSVLLGAPEISALVSGRVYAGELPSSEVTSMPRKVVVITYAGGDAKRGMLPVSGARIQVISWAETYHEAGRLDAAVFDVLEDVIRMTIEGALIHAIMPIGAPTALRDTDTGWPAYMRPATVIIDQRAIEEVE